MATNLVARRGTLLRYRSIDVLSALTLAALRDRYGRGPLRFLKWLLDPFALVGVYLLLVTFVLNRAGVAPGLSLACAVVPFQLVTSTTTTSLSSVNMHRSVIMNMQFRRTLIPLATTITELIAFAASFVLIAVMMVAYQVEPTTALVWLPLVVLQTAFFALAVSFPAALFGLYFRELRIFALSFVRTLFFLSSGLIPLASISGDTPTYLRLNPFTGLFESYRAVFLFGHRPAVWDLIYPVAVAALLLAVFVPIYRSEQRQFAKVVD